MPKPKFVKETLLKGMRFVYCDTNLGLLIVFLFSFMVSAFLAFFVLAMLGFQQCEFIEVTGVIFMICGCYWKK